MSKIPHFNSEREESDFWDTHAVTDYLDELTPADATFVDARPRKTLISLRLDPSAIALLKVIAHKKGVGYQTLIRMWVMERLEHEAKTRQDETAATRPRNEVART
ncbi:MAG: BrnA antitoxin family protein [Chloroflexota bacterium]|nr:BrnA antitoxin family protein [Chloroflexota bacterium]